MVLDVTQSAVSAHVPPVGLARDVWYPVRPVRTDLAVTRHVNVLTMLHVTLSGVPASVCQAGRACTVMSHVLMGECQLNATAVVVEKTLCQ